MPEEAKIKYVIDFKGGMLDEITDVAQLVPDVSVDAGDIMNPVVQKNSVDGGYRLFFDFKPNGRTGELRAFLKSAREADKDAVLTEVWTYQYLP